MISRFRRWEAWAVYERDGVRVGERKLRDCFTRRGAERWADSCTNNPQVLARTFSSAAHGPMIFVNPDVRRVGE